MLALYASNDDTWLDIPERVQGAVKPELVEGSSVGLIF